MRIGTADIARCACGTPRTHEQYWLLSHRQRHMGWPNWNVNSAPQVWRLKGCSLPEANLLPGVSERYRKTATSDWRMRKETSSTSRRTQINDHGRCRHRKARIEGDGWPMGLSAVSRLTRPWRTSEAWTWTAGRPMGRVRPTARHDSSERSFLNQQTGLMTQLATRGTCTILYCMLPDDYVISNIVVGLVLIVNA